MRLVKKIHEIKQLFSVLYQQVDICGYKNLVHMGHVLQDRNFVHELVLILQCWGVSTTTGLQPGFN